MNKRKLFWIIFGVVLLIIMGGIKLVLMQKVLFSPVSVTSKYNFLDCKKDLGKGTCDEAHNSSAGSSCTNSEGDSGICIYVLWSDGDCYCKAPSKTTFGLK